MPEPIRSKDRSWRQKFGDAFRGLREGVRGQSSFFVHFSLALAVIAVGVALGLGLIEWCLLILCIATVLTAEMFNTAMESLARAITRHMNPHIGRALNIGSAAVLIVAVGAAIVGAIIFLNRLGIVAGWWAPTV
jgi:diacylglycerol kinase